MITLHIAKNQFKSATIAVDLQNKTSITKRRMQQAKDQNQAKIT
jgi:hypothetical protein